MKCSTCGMAEKDNPAHSDSSGDDTGKHAFTAAAKKSADELSLVEDTPIQFGGELKSLGNGKIGGYAIIFTGPTDPDITNDFFNKDTDFFFEGESKAIRPILYDHGLDPTLKSRKLGRGTLEIKDAGVWFEAELALADAYDRYIDEMAQAGKLGVSTGSAPHLITREKIGKSALIKSWPIVEVSLTPKPIEPRTKKSMSLKSYAEEHDDDSVFDGLEADADVAVEPVKVLRPAKGIFDQELAETGTSFYELNRILCDITKDIKSAADTVDISGGEVNVQTNVTEAVTEYAARLIPLLTGQIQKSLDDGGDYLAPSFYVKALFDIASPLQFLLSVKSSLVSKGQLDEHSAKVVSAIGEFADQCTSLNDRVKAWSERCEEKIQFRANDSTKSGRTSAATAGKLAEARSRLKPAIDSMLEMHTHLQKLEEMATVKKGVSDADILSVQIALASQRHELEMAGVPLTTP